jgi:hypothetical protein
MLGWRLFSPVRCLRRLPPLMDAHHAHSSRFYLAAYRCRRRSWRRVYLDVLGIRADQAAPTRWRRSGRQASTSEQPTIASRRSPDKKQGRRRSITSTALPAPDIEIGLRHPVNCMMPRNATGICDPVHIRREKVVTAAGADGLLRDDSAKARAGFSRAHLLVCAATPRCASS